jgi:hypothetical protein
MTLKTIIQSIAVLSAMTFMSNCDAEEYEVTTFVGKMYSSDVIGVDGTDINVDEGNNFGVAFAWQDSPNGQGQVMLNYVSHDFFSPLAQSNDSLDILYAHFNGVAMFRQAQYVTTMSLGLGGAYFDADNGSEELYPSASIAFGTRYEFSATMALVTELRAYATLIDEDDQLFCRNDNCTANFDDSLWIDSTISIGLAIKF